MSSTSCGYAVIVTMAKGRPGADIDEASIEKLFQQLGFQVIKIRDVTKDVSMPVSNVYIYMTTCGTIFFFSKEQ